MSTNINSDYKDLIEEKLEHILTKMEGGFALVRQEISEGNDRANNIQIRMETLDRETKTVRFLAQNRALTFLMLVGFIFTVGSDLIPYLKLLIK